MKLRRISKRLLLSSDLVKTVEKKCDRLGLEVVGVVATIKTTTSIPIPKELPSVEEALGMLAGALRASCKPGLDKVEVQRLQLSLRWRGRTRTFSRIMSIIEA